MDLTLDYVRNMLPCNKHRLDDELEIQPDIMQRIAREVVRTNSRMLEAKDDLAREEGRLGEELKEDDPKLTVGGVDAKVKRHADRIKAWQKYQRARTDYEDWLYVLDAWRQKGYSLKTLADLYTAQYFSVDSTSMTPRQRERTDRQDEARAEMRKSSARIGGSSADSTPSASSTRRRIE